MTENKKAHPRCAEIYKYIVNYIVEHQYPPTVREIRSGVSVNSTSTVYKYMEELKEQGKIDFQSKQPRTITVNGYKFVKDEQSD